MRWIGFPDMPNMPDVVLSIPSEFAETYGESGAFIGRYIGVTGMQGTM